MTDANATHGGPRPGAGRKHLDGTPPGRDAADPSERHTVTMPASMWEVVKNAGGGVYSIGLRIIVESWIAVEEYMAEENAAIKEMEKRTR